MSRILVHDYAGHPFQVELSRELANRGHVVSHVFSASTHTPQGTLRVLESDPEDFRIVPIDLGEMVAKGSWIRRRRQEIRYGKLLVREAERFKPDVVLSGNTPPDAQRHLLAFCANQKIRFVYWLQDSFGEGIRRVLAAKAPVLGAPIAWYYSRLERSMLNASDSVILITPDFENLLDPEARDKAHHIPNWAPLSELPTIRRDNEWARIHGLVDKRTLLYAGTLGMKHNPQLLLSLADGLREEEDVNLVVVSEGAGAEWLATEATARQLRNLLVLPFQAFSDLPAVLATGDVLLAILEEEAGSYSVPSKVLTCLCAGRALLLAVPPMNLAARVVRDADAGIVVRPSDTAGFVDAARFLLGDAVTRHRLGKGARAYAESHFGISTIADRFELALHVQGAGGAVMPVADQYAGA